MPGRNLLSNAVLLLLAGSVVGLVVQENLFYINIVSTIALMYVLAAGYNILFGYAGLVSLGHPALYGIGAYGSALLGHHATGLPWLVTVLFAAALAGALGVLMALPTARLHAEFLALATLALTIATEQVLDRWTSLTGGVHGTADIPYASVFGRDFIGGTSDFYFLGMFFAVLSYLVIARLLRSRLGRNLHALRDSELAPQSVGIDPVRERAVAFGLSGAFAGVAGALFASFTLYLVPAQFGFIVMVQILTMALVGGVGTQLGPLLGAIFLVVVGQQAFGDLGPDWEQLCYTSILLVLIVFFRQGIAGIVQQQYSAVRRRRASTRAAAASGGAAASGPGTGTPEPTGVPAIDLRVKPTTLAVSDVSVTFGGVHAVEHVSLEVRTSEIVGLIGPNGAGKSTLVNAATGVVVPSSGEVTLGGSVVSGREAHRVARAGIARTFQHPQLCPDLSVLANVMLGCTGSARARLPELVLHLPRSIADERRFEAEALALLEFVGIAEYAKLTAGECPYGVQRRIELARAVATRPSFILVDEIGAGLDDQERANLVEVLRLLAADGGPGMVLIDHNMDLVRKVCDRVVVLERGRLLVEGEVDHVLADPRVLDVYLGSKSGAAHV